PGLRDHLPVVGRVRGQRLRALTIGPAEDLAADLVRSRRLGQRRHERRQQRDPRERKPDDEHASSDHAAPAAGVSRPPTPKRGRGGDSQGKDLPGHELPLNAVDSERDHREHEGADGQSFESGWASTPGEGPPQPGRERNDDHQAVDDAHVDSMLGPSAGSTLKLNIIPLSWCSAMWQCAIQMPGFVTSSRMSTVSPVRTSTVSFQTRFSSATPPRESTTKRPAPWTWNGWCIGWSESISLTSRSLT